ncbi:MAG: transposase [Anaerocolumna sp.]
MSFKTNDYQQITLDDRFNALSSRTQKIVLKSWAKDFADIVFPAINEERFSVLYSEQAFSRPNTPINVTVGSLILKEMLGLSDDELLDSICCDTRFQYALHTTSFSEQPISDRTFSRFRERLYNYEVTTGIDLLKEEMKSLADAYGKYLNLNSNLKRMDSLMIASNCKRMSRLEIVYTVVANAVKLLERLGENELIPTDMLHYLDSDDHNDVIYHSKNEDVTDRLTTVIKDAGRMRNLMSGDEWLEFSEYQLLSRVLCEQAQEENDGCLKPKPKSEIQPHSLQNPSDPDATYRSKAGKEHKGYVGNIVETVGENGCTLISDVCYEKNSHSDSAFCKEYLDSHNDKLNEIMLADGAYSGTENSCLAKEKNVELITTALTGRQPDTIMAGFELSVDGKEVIHCPMNQQPIKSSYYDNIEMCRAVFQKESCKSCPNRSRCKVKIQNKTAVVMVSSKMAERARYLKKISSDDYLKLTRKRNGVEGIPSVLRRKYNVDNIPVRGLLRSKTFFLFKVGAYNIRKLIKHLPVTREKSTLLLATV